MKIGGWTGKVSEASPDDTKEIHRKDDLDFDRSSHHHTIGDGPNQAASGALVKALAEAIGAIGPDPGPIVPVWSTGDVKVTFGVADNVNWFLLGSTISRTGDGAALFALFGTTFGIGDGSTTFRLPDPSDRVLKMLGASSGESPAAFGGSASNSKVITTANLPPHVHAGATHTHNMAHVHPYTRRINTSSIATGAQRGGGALEPSDDTGGASPSDTGNNTASNTGNGGFANTALDVTNAYFTLRALIHA